VSSPTVNKMLAAKHDLFTSTTNVNQCHKFCLTLEKTKDMLAVVVRNNTNQKRWYEFSPMMIDETDKSQCTFKICSTRYKSYLPPKTLIYFDHTASIGFPDDVEADWLMESHVLHGKVKLLIWHKEPVEGKEDWDDFFDIDCKIQVCAGISCHSTIRTDWAATTMGE
jgi:hypothetical protein